MTCCRTSGKMTAGYTDNRADVKSLILASAGLNNEHSEALVSGYIPLICIPDSKDNPALFSIKINELKKSDALLKYVSLNLFFVWPIVPSNRFDRCALDGRHYILCESPKICLVRVKMVDFRLSLED